MHWTNSPSERWLKNAAELSPDLSSRYKTQRATGRPRKIWEDDINDFLKQIREEKENENPIERSNQTNKNWNNIAKDSRNDCVIMTEIKMKTKLPSKKSREEETMTLSTAAAPQTRSALQASACSM